MHLILLILLTVSLLAAAAALVVWLRTPDVGRLVTSNPDRTEFMRYRDMERANEAVSIKQTWVGLPQISTHLIESVIMGEDRTFLTHRGFYWEEMWKSMLYNIRKRRVLRGGSSITQQLAKNLFLNPSRSFRRKFKEALITIKLENELSKARILEIYLNVIEWGDGIYGAEEASRHYFGKPASELSLAEAVRLSACVSGPRVFSPLDGSNEYLNSREIHILESLLRHGRISRMKYVQTLRELNRFFESDRARMRLVSYPEPPEALNHPEYWVSRIRDADRVVMDAREIEAFNLRARLIGGGMDIFSLPEYLPADEVRDKILEVAGFEFLRDAGCGGENAYSTSPFVIHTSALNAYELYDSDDQPLTAGLYSDVLGNLGLGGITDSSKVRYALTLTRTDILSWPYEGLVMNKKFDYEFNRLQLSSLNICEKAAVIHSSADGLWVFVRTAFVDGWVRARDIALTSREAAAAYPGDDFLVVTAPGAATEGGVGLQAGVRLARTGTDAGYYTIGLPSEDGAGNLSVTEDRVAGRFVHEGPLPYTKSNVIETAFKFLGTAYGWGGSGGGEDCSSFIKAVFSVFGIDLPRNSAPQSGVGRTITKPRGERLTRKNSPARRRGWNEAVTLLGFPGHIMLYLGEADGEPYAIHSVWGIAVKSGETMRVGKVAVTDLGLGGGSRTGSLFSRITNISTIETEPPGLRSLGRDFLYALEQHPWRLKLILKALSVLLASAALLLIVF